MDKVRLRAYIYLTITALIWGIATYVIKVTLVGIAPLPFLTYRFALSTLLAIPMLIVSRKHLQKIVSNFWEVALYSFLTTTFALGILFFGMEKTTVIDSALIAAVSPLLTAWAGVLFLSERITTKEKIGIAIAFIGTLLTVLEPLFANHAATKISGNLLVVGYVIVMAFSSVLSKKLVRKDIDPLTLTNVTFIVGLVTILPFTFSQTSLGSLATTIGSLPLNIHLGVLYMAALSGTLAYALWVRAQKSIEVSEAGLFAYLTPIFAAPLGIWFLHEKVTPILILGGLLIVIGVVFAELKRGRQN